MRIASVLHDASLDKDGAPLLPVVALERDGALYRVDELSRALGATCAIGEPCDLGAAIALRGEAFREIDERVRSGERPSSARLLPGTFTWLPPCDTERAALLVCGADGAASPDRGPSFRMASARALLGHEATVPVLADVSEIAVACAVAAVLGDDLFRATAREAEAAILGYTLMLSFDRAAGAQLGPSIVTRDECGSVVGLRAQIRVDGQPTSACEVSDHPLSPAETIAWISHHAPLRAGDVIGALPLRSGSIDDRDPILRVPFGARVELAVERIGRLAGRPARGPEMRAWRLSPA